MSAKKLPSFKHASVDIKIKNMMNDGFYFEVEPGKRFSPLVALYRAKTDDDLYATIAKQIEAVLIAKPDVHTVVIGTVGYNDLDAAIKEKGGMYEATLAIAGY